MEVVAFVGPSGTGKSHRAVNVAYAHGCDAIIDDGLLIKGTHILAGVSAKNEDNKIQAVKRAIFTDPEHARNVQLALAKSDIRRLLVIATSDNMVNRILERLGLPEPIQRVYINQVVTKAEIKKARYERLHYGKHVVPVPNVELKPHFTGYFADLPYNLFASDGEPREGDRSIVRPPFSFYGKLLVSDSAVEDIIRLIAAKDGNVQRLRGVSVRRRSGNGRGIVISMDLVLYYGAKVFDVTRALQEKIKQRVEYMTAMNVNNVNITIRSLAPRPKVVEKTS